MTNNCKQLKHNLFYLAWLRRCLGCSLRKLSHLNNLCELLYKVHCIFVATLEYESLLTLLPADCVDRGLAVTIFSDWVFWSNTKALHLDSRNVTSSAVAGVSAREAVFNSHSCCVSVSSLANIK